jgi:hypothetical protein
MHLRPILTLLVAACLACATIAPALSAHRVPMSASSQSIVADLTDFYYTGDSGTMTAEKGGTFLEFGFSGAMTINGKSWTSYSKNPQEGGPPVPSPLKLHCTLMRIYYSTSGGQRTATAIKTISNNASRYFC